MVMKINDKGRRGRGRLKNIWLNTNESDTRADVVRVGDVENRANGCSGQGRTSPNIWEEGEREEED